MKSSIFINVGKGNAPTNVSNAPCMYLHITHMIDNVPKKIVVVQSVCNPAVTDTRQQLSPYSI